MARIHATTAEGGEEIVHGYNTTRMRGAGIRVYEYASQATAEAAKVQLECLIWACADVEDMPDDPRMNRPSRMQRQAAQMKRAREMDLWDVDRLHNARLINQARHTVCPLCLDELSVSDFLKRADQAAGRETYDLTLTEVTLFHIDELRVGKLQHKPYNLGWGHAHCNTVVKDAGIMPTLKWMKSVLDRNGDSWARLEKETASVEEAVNR